MFAGSESDRLPPVRLTSRLGVAEIDNPVVEVDEALIRASAASVHEREPHIWQSGGPDPTELSFEGRSHPVRGATRPGC